MSRIPTCTCISVHVCELNRYTYNIDAVMSENSAVLGCDAASMSNRPLAGIRFV